MPQAVVFSPGGHGPTTVPSGVAGRGDVHAGRRDVGVHEADPVAGEGGVATGADAARTGVVEHQAVLEKSPRCRSSVPAATEITHGDWRTG